jgi:V-type H+-transporting ATPase subunit a
MSMLRSERMELLAVYFSKDTAKQTVAELGKNDILHFNNLNANVKRESLLYTQETGQLERVMFRFNCLKAGIENPDEKIKHSDIDEVVEQIDKHYFRLAQLKAIKKETDVNLVKLREDLCMLEETENFLGAVSEDTHSVQFEFMTGIVSRDRKFLIKKILHQALRRNLAVRTKDVLNDNMTVFIAFAHGKEALVKITEIFYSLGGRILEDRRFRECRKGLLELTAVISQMQKVGDHNDQAVQRELQKIGEVVNSWRYYLNREMKIYETLNKLSFDVDRDCLVGEAWVLRADVPRLKKLCELTGDGSSRFAFELLKASEMPPTHFRTSRFSQPFQALTNVYGIPSYGEINPAIFSIFTFPMLFGCMFGDVFHGLILLGLSYLCIRYYHKLNKKYDSIQLILDGRYVLLLSSLGAIFFGFLYSDFGSVPIRLFASQFDVERTYPFGIDYKWLEAENSMEFLNSVKMKMSIIIGFFHMNLGIVISFMNALHFRNKIDLIGLLIPQTIIYAAFLGYLVFLIIYKWLVTSNKPSLIGVLVNMFTTPFTLGEEMYPNQHAVQLTLLGIMLLCLPWLVFSKPLYLIFKQMVERDKILELWIDQFIHCIEFGIGLISNTASYLRLWAVSLAHQQLTDVLHRFTIGQKNLVAAFSLLGVYIAATFLMLIGMEGLSSCLHALRLNWVEFHSKFYKGEGYAFEPLSFTVVDDE